MLLVLGDSMDVSDIVVDGCVDNTRTSEWVQGGIGVPRVVEELFHAFEFFAEGRDRLVRFFSEFDVIEREIIRI